MNEFGLTQLLALYAAVVSTVALSWNIGRDIADRKKKQSEQRKIRVSFGIPIIKRNVPHFGTMHILPICIANLGREDVIITGVEMRYPNAKFHPGAYNEPDAALGKYGERLLPRRLNPGDVLTLEQFTLAAFQDTPVDIAAFDAEGNEYRIDQDDLKRMVGWAREFRAELAGRTGQSCPPEPPP